MFVHCCHCTRCQRETGAPYAHHAMIEFSRFAVTRGEPMHVLVPTDSGRRHWVARCPECHTAMWNEHGPRTAAAPRALTRYVRVGTLDAPQALPPQAHIFVRSRQPWVALGDELPRFSSYYDAATTWPAASLARYASAKALLAQQARDARAAARRRS